MTGQIKKDQRTVYRTAFAKINNAIVDLCEAEKPKLTEIQASLDVVEHKLNLPVTVDKAIIVALLETNLD